MQKFSDHFICYSKQKNEFEKHLNAPIFRRKFNLTKVESSSLTICGLGFYRVFLNNIEITKGLLAPYISNTDDAVYYDTYDITQNLIVGENVLTVLLGNGFQNGIGGDIWQFDKASWRSEPKLALSLYVNNNLLFEADERFECALSPITFDDLWSGERYDARKESQFIWQLAVKTDTPKGEKRCAKNFSIIIKKEIKTKKIMPYKNGYVFDFGFNSAGICRLKVKAKAGQKITFYHFETFKNDVICTENISFGKRTRENYWQQEEYITKDGLNVYQPSFTYHGFRYIYVEGLTESQVKKSTFTMLAITCNAKKVLQFSCSNKKIEKLVDAVINTDESNFIYFPTDCPQREKNGWTGDAFMSTEQMLTAFDNDEYFKEWLYCIIMAQRESGQIPRIVPTADWGFSSCESGPNWDGVIVEIPYQLYKKTGDKNVIIKSLPAVKKYLNYVGNMRKDNGLISFGFGDREESFTYESSEYNTPLEITDTLTAIALCNKTEEMAIAVGDNQVKDFAFSLKSELKKAFIDLRTDKVSKVTPLTQTGQCLAIFAEIFDGENEKMAVDELVQLLKKDGVVKMGIIGYRYLFETLAKHGQSELACQLLLTENYSGYLYYIARGMTSLPESFAQFKPNSFIRVDGGRMLSQNHHWYGHILASIVKYVVGIQFDGYGRKTLKLTPCFFDKIKDISATVDIGGKLTTVSWKRVKDKVILTVNSNINNVELSNVENYRLTDKVIKDNLHTFTFIKE